MASPVLARLGALDAALVASGFPPTSPWWRDTLRSFYSNERRQLVLRVGRRGGKSSTLCRVGVTEALYGAHRIPPGDVGVVAIVSVSRDEASQRLRTVKAILDALGVKYRPIDGGIELAERPIVFKVYAASVAGVSGFTCIAAICDEVAKWRDADTGANPAREVLSSLRPTMATQPNARIFLSSSPLGHLDAHAAAFDAGDDDFQRTAFAPTWVANPTVTEAATHELEPDENRWRREYGATPLEGDETSLVSAALLDRATRSELGDVEREAGVTYVSAQDPGFTRNPWTFVIAGKRWVDGRIKRSIVLAREWRGTTEKPLEPAWVLGQIATLCRPYGVEVVESDQYERFGLQSIAGRPEIGLYINVRERSAVERLGRYEAMCTQMSDGEIDLPPDRQLRADLLAVKQKLTPNGFTIALPQTPDGRHADYAPSVSLALSQCRIDPQRAAPRLSPEERSAAQLKSDEDRMWAAARAARKPGQRVILDQMPRAARRFG